MAQETTRGSPGKETNSNGNAKPGDPRPEPPRTISSLTSSIPGAYPDDVASIASIKSGIAPAVPGMRGALTGSSAILNKSLPGTQGETGSGDELQNGIITGFGLTGHTGSDGAFEGSNDTRGDLYG
jgi:hypothetical protein